MMSSGGSYSGAFQPGARKAQPGGVRFTPNQFQYNGRVALALLPCLAVLAGFGGTPVVGILLVGGAATYILDAARYKEGSFAAAWLTMGLANAGLLFGALFMGEQRPLLLSVLIFLLNALTLTLTGIWATLQFKFLQLQYPAVVLAFEKLLLMGCIPAGSAVLTWGVASGVGMSNTPYFLAGILCGLYYLFAMPLQSSFQQSRETALGGASSRGTCIQDRSDGFIAFLLVTMLPAGVYVATHLVVLFSWFHLWSLLLLGAGPLLFVTCLPDGLWWLRASPRAADGLRRALLLLSLAVFLAGLEGRVVFYSLGQYIHLAPPWNYLAATLVLYGLAALVLLHFAGALNAEAEGVLLGPGLMVTAALASLAMGVPIWVLPAPLLAAAGLSMFYDTGALRDYLLFVAGGVLTGLWFLWHHFFFLDIWLGHMHLKLLCGLIGVAMLPALLLPGLVHGRHGVHHARQLVGGLMVVQAGLLCALEEQLYGGDHEDITHNVHTMYPAFLVVLTSMLGMLVSHRLHEAGLVGEVSNYLLTCIYCAKLTMLVLPDAELTVPSLGLLLAVTPPLLLHGARDAARHPRPPGAPPPPPPRLSPALALGSVVLVALAVIAARFAVFDIARFMLDRRPSEALVAGLLVLCMAAGCLPLVTRYYSHSAAAKRGVMLAVAFGLLLVLLRPPLPITGGSECPKLPFGLCPRLWNEEHTPDHEEDDISIYGDGLRRREHWPLWFLVGAVVFGLSALTSRVAAHRVAGARLAQAAVSAALVGTYLALDFFPGMPLVQICVLVSALLVAAFMVLLQVPGASSAVLLPFLLLLWGATFPLAVLAQAASKLPPLPVESERLFPDGYHEVEEERMEAIKSAVLAVFAGEALLLAFALKLRVSSAVGGGGGSGAAAAAGTRPRMPASALGLGMDASYVDKAAGFLGQCMPLYALQPGSGKSVLQGSGGVALQRLSAEGLGWVPTCGNLATLGAVLLAVTLNFEFTGGDDAGILVIAPLLLLLSQDPVLMRGLTEARRYFPPVALASVYLAASIVYQLADGYSSGGQALMSMDAASFGYLTKNAVCLLACLPSQWELLWHLWGGWGDAAPSPSAGGGFWVAAAAPLNLVPLALADLEGLRVLAGVGLLGACVQLAAIHKQRHAGLKVI